jgi:hypothetical protein
MSQVDTRDRQAGPPVAEYATGGGSRQVELSEVDTRDRQAGRHVDAVVDPKSHLRVRGESLERPLHRREQVPAAESLRPELDPAHAGAGEDRDRLEQGIEAAGGGAERLGIGDRVEARRVPVAPREAAASAHDEVDTGAGLIAAIIRRSASGNPP